MKFTNWDELHSACMQCTACNLHQTRKNVVFGVGNKNAEVLFIGEGPGKMEDELGEPFVGRAGHLLDDMLAAIGLDRTKIYIANMVKCRPPENRDPLPAEQDACMDYLRAQTMLIKPKIIVCLGRVAATKIIRSDFKITAEHGQVFERGKYRYIALYHPAYLLRDPRKLPETFEDLKTLENLILSLCVHTYRQ